MLEDGSQADPGLDLEVTARKRAEEALRESERRMADLCRVVKAGFLVTRQSDQTIVEVNEEWLKLFGWSRPEVIGRTTAELGVFASPSSSAWLFAELQSTGTITPAEALVVRKDGTTAICLLSASIATGGGESVASVWQDVTALREASAALRESEAKFTALSRSSIIGLVTATVEGRLLEANDAFLEMLGYTREELQGGGMRWDLLTPPGWQQVNSLIGAEIEDHGFAGPLEKEYLHRNGTAVPAILGVAPIDHETRITWILDISDRKRLEQVQREAHELETENRRIQESSRLKSEFLANMSHELRTPLNAIIGFSELVHEGEMPLEEARAYAGHVLASARHLLGLINGVLDLVKVEAGKMEFRPREVWCSALASEAVDALGAQAAAKRMKVEVVVDPSLREGLFLDPARLKQVLLNYLSNALKFTPEGGHVAVRMLPEGDDFFRIEVEDDGPGIAAGDLPRLFVEFQQLQGGVGRSHEGTGLGLALTRHLVEAQGGSVGVRSEPGRGSVFHAVLPRRAGTPRP